LQAASKAVNVDVCKLIIKTGPESATLIRPKFFISLFNNAELDSLFSQTTEPFRGDKIIVMAAVTTGSTLAAKCIPTTTNITTTAHITPVNEQIPE